MQLIFELLFSWICEETPAKASKRRFVIHGVLRTLFYLFLIGMMSVCLYLSLEKKNIPLLLFSVVLIAGGCWGLVYFSRLSYRNYQRTYAK